MDDEPGPAVLALQVQGLGELPGVHRGRAEVADLAGLDQVVQGLQGLLQRCRVVIAVNLVEVDVVGAEPPQAVVDLGHDRLAGQAPPVRPRPHRVAQLGGNHDVVAVREVTERAAEDLLAGAVRVQVGGVEEVDASLEGMLDERAAGFLVQRPDRVAAVGIAVGHRADGDRGHVQAGSAKLDVAHGALLSLWRLLRLR